MFGPPEPLELRAMESSCRRRLDSAGTHQMVRKPFKPDARQQALIAQAIAATEQTSDGRHPAPAELVERMVQEEECAKGVGDGAGGDGMATREASDVDVEAEFAAEGTAPSTTTSRATLPASTGAGTDASADAQAEVPADFPRSTHTGALPGAAPKLLARMLNGRYVVGLTAEELAVRYDGCVDLVEQLQRTAGQFAARNPSWTAVELRERMRRGVEHEQHRWKLSPAEARWVLMELARREGWVVGDLQDGPL